MMRAIHVGIVCGLALVAAGARGGDEKKPYQNSADEIKIFDLTNLERKKKDLPLLKLSIPLSKVARGHSENMARQGKMEHKLDDKTPFDRLRGAGYLFAKAGENLAMGDDGIPFPSIMKAWMDSPGHRDNILYADYTEIGVGVARDKSRQIYFTQVFAKQKKQ